MGFTLRPGVTFCITGNRPIFLDVTNDRYFCLAVEAEFVECCLHLAAWT